MNNSHFERNSNENIMIFTGEGKIAVNPNLAIIRLGVQTLGLDLASIQMENAAVAQSIIELLERMDVTDIKTFQYTIDKVYDYENGRQIDRGYSVRNILEIKTNNLDAVGTIIDAAVNQGANVVEFITFDISDRNYYYNQALNLAIQNAFEKADSVANNFNFHIYPIPRRIVEGINIMPYPRLDAVRESFTTPIVPGSKDVVANVTVEFTIY